MNIGIIDFLITGMIALITWCVAAEGAVGAGTTFVAVILSGLLAMNFFEPLADLLDNIAFIGDRADMIALLGLFAVFVTLARLAAEKINPTFISLHGLAYDLGRWGFGFLTAYTTAAIALTALHTAPLPREFLGFRPERTHHLFDAFAPDREWLGFTQYVTEKPFAKTQVVNDPRFGQFRVPRIFDGRTAYHWGLDGLKSTRVIEEARRSSVTGAAPSDQELAVAATKIVVPSFILRYAARRGSVGGSQAEAQPGPPPTAAPAGGPAF